ncbi:MAG TPA: hypothetical protein VGF45_16720, partial [Polyangia bacterium]
LRGPSLFVDRSYTHQDRRNRVRPRPCAGPRYWLGSPRIGDRRRRRDTVEGDARGAWRELPMDIAYRRAHLAARAMALALTVSVAAGCGSDDHDPGGIDADAAGTSAVQTDTDGSDTGRKTSEDGSTAGGDEREIQVLFAKMRDAIATTDGKTACGLMARSSRRTFMALAGPGPKTCERGFVEAFSSGTDEDLDPEFVKVEIQGPRATVYGRATTSKGLQQAPFVKEGDDWKVESWLTD